MNAQALRRWGRRLDVWARLMRLDRPIGTWLLLWPAMWALWIAGGGHPDGQLVLVFALGAFLMRSAGCVINDFADRKIDPLVARTRSRPLAAGEARPAEALALFALLCLLAFALVLTTNPLTVKLSLAAVLLAAVYPFSKRVTHLPQVVLGAAFGMSVPMAFAAQAGAVPPVAWLLYAANLCWVVAYDTIYAMVDREDDLRAGVKSTAILFGRHDRRIIGLLQAAFIALMAFAGWRTGMGAAFAAGLGFAAGLLLWQQRLIRAREPQACFRAFLNNHAVGAAVFAGIALDSMRWFFLA